PIYASKKPDVLQYSKVFIQGKLLAHVSNILLDQFRLPINIETRNLCASRGRYGQSAQHPHGSRFSRTVCAQQTKNFPGIDVETYPVHGNKISKVLAELFRPDHHFIFIVPGSGWTWGKPLRLMLIHFCPLIV